MGFYPKPKVDSALIGLYFVSNDELKIRLAGVNPKHLRIVLSTTFQQRRKVLRNSIKKLLLQVYNGDKEKVLLCLSSIPPSPPTTTNLHDDDDDSSFFSRKQRTLPNDWSSKRPEELNPGQFIELTRLVYGPIISNNEKNYNEIYNMEFPNKVWRKM